MPRDITIDISQSSNQERIGLHPVKPGDNFRLEHNETATIKNWFGNRDVPIELNESSVKIKTHGQHEYKVSLQPISPRSQKKFLTQLSQKVSGEGIAVKFSLLPKEKK